MAGLKISFEIENIGPHAQVSFIEKSPSLKTAFYANNGSGKTFISRLFRLLENPSSQKSDKLLSFTKNEGKFKFEVSDDTTTKTVNVQITKASEPIISSPLPFIFHVFNSDYVHENIEALGYKPDGNIEGYILGKVQIDLTKEKAELEKKKLDYANKKSNFEDRIDKSKQELDNKDLGITKSIIEYKNFNIDNIYNKQNLDYVEDKTFSELKKESTTLNTLPDNLLDISSNTFNIQANFLENITLILEKSYTKSLFAEEFKTKIKSKQGFIENGLRLINDDSCPFCEQSLDKSAIELIDTYTQYLEDEEAKVISEIENHIKNIENFKKQVNEAYKQSLKSKTSFDNTKKYLPSYKEENIDLLQDSKTLDDDLKIIIELLQDKKDDITKNLNINQQIINIESFIRTNSKTISINNKKIVKINDMKNNISKEKLNIKKRLCKSQYIATLEAEIDSINEMNKIQKAIRQLEIDISDKESQAKALKKDKVIEAFEDFLNIFFAGKYTFDKDKFCLKFNTQILIDNASDVLSDGEKSIVAFCFFLAETHKKIQKEEDYKKLLFVIDDPISSLDFHYVYSVAQIIRRLNDNSRFPIGERLRYIILTHNIEFMSILIRNKIIDGRFILEKSGIRSLQKELIMPYEEHLRDVFEVSEKEKIPSHTTPNSIRHILETINKFEKPNLNFLQYCEDIELLKDDNEFLYALVHDNSHGNYRTQTASTPDMIIKGCKKVIQVISTKFGGQLDVIKRSK